VLRFDLPEPKLHAAFKELQGGLNASAPEEGKNGAYELSVANAVWTQQGYPILGSFLDVVTESYRGQACQADFQKDVEGARRTINDWVEKQTREKIKDLIPSGGLEKLTRLVLTNAIYFKGRWAEPFEKKLTRDAPFTPAVSRSFRGLTRKVMGPMMRQTGRFGYLETDRMQLLEMPYEGRDLSMLVFLPRPPDGTSQNRHTLEDLAALEQSITAKNLDTWTQKLRRQDVRVWLPKFSLTCGFSLAAALQAMGMTDAFSSKADLSGINGKRTLFIGAVFHKAFVDVYEEGTEAAAATAVAVPESVPQPRPRPKMFQADHPFVFLIRHRKTGSVLFMGRVMNPAQ
jgi:serpin B